MAKRKGNREFKKPKQEKPKRQAAESVSELSSASGAPAKRKR